MARPARERDAEAPPAASPLLTALVFLVGFSLQSGIFIVGPLLPEIARDLAISGSIAGALAAIPPLMMGLGAIPGGSLTQRIGPARMIGLGMATIGIAGAMRGAAPGWLALLGLTVLFGAAIGVMQPAGPAFIRDRFPERVGPMTSVYTFGLVSGIIVASGLVGPVIAPLAGGWRGALAVWGAIAVVTAALWLAVTRGARMSAVPAAGGAARPSDWSPWRSRVAWLAAALYASQGIVFFLLGSWLPAVYAEAGISAGGIGGRMTVLTAASLPAIVLLPSWAARLGSVRVPLIVSAVLTLAGALGFFAATTTAPLDWVWPLLAGFGVGGILVLVLVLVAEISPAELTGETAAMVLAVGYTTTALGPFLAGVIRDLSGGFRTAMLVLPVVAAAMLLLAVAMPRSSARTGDGG